MRLALRKCIKCGHVERNKAVIKCENDACAVKKDGPTGSYFNVFNDALPSRGMLLRNGSLTRQHYPKTASIFKSLPSNQRLAESHIRKSELTERVSTIDVDQQCDNAPALWCTVVLGSGYIGFYLLRFAVDSVLLPTLSCIPYATFLVGGLGSMLCFVTTHVYKRIHCWAFICSVLLLVMFRLLPTWNSIMMFGIVVAFVKPAILPALCFMYNMSLRPLPTLPSGRRLKKIDFWWALLVFSNVLLCLGGNRQWNHNVLSPHWGQWPRNVIPWVVPKVMQSVVFVHLHRGGFIWGVMQQHVGQTSEMCASFTGVRISCDELRRVREFNKEVGYGMRDAGYRTIRKAMSEKHGLPGHAWHVGHACPDPSKKSMHDKEDYGWNLFAQHAADNVKLGHCLVTCAEAEHAGAHHVRCTHSARCKKACAVVRSNNNYDGGDPMPATFR